MKIDINAAILAAEVLTKVVLPAIQNIVAVINEETPDIKAMEELRNLLPADPESYFEEETHA